MSWSDSVATMPFMIGLLRSPSLYSCSTCCRYWLYWPARRGYCGSTALPSAPWQAKQAAALVLPFAALPLASSGAEANARTAPHESRASARCMRGPWLLDRREAGQVGGDVLDVLLGQALRLRRHRRIRAVAALVLVQRIDDVLLVLPGDLRHGIVRVGVGVTRHAVAAGAGVDQRASGRLVAFGVRAGGGQQGKSTRQTKYVQSNHRDRSPGAATDANECSNRRSIDSSSGRGQPAVLHDASAAFCRDQTRLRKMWMPALYSPTMVPRLTRKKFSRVRATRFFHQPLQCTMSSRSVSKSATRGRRTQASAVALMPPAGMPGRNGLIGAAMNAARMLSGCPPAASAPNAAKPPVNNTHAISACVPSAALRWNAQAIAANTSNTRPAASHFGQRAFGGDCASSAAVAAGSPCCSRSSWHRPFRCPAPITTSTRRGVPVAVRAASSRRRAAM